jgi:hypothetical protein
MFTGLNRTYVLLKDYTIQAKVCQLATVLMPAEREKGLRDMHLRSIPRRLTAYWRRRKFTRDLNRMEPGELAVLVQMGRLSRQWPRRWWWVDEWREVYVIGT